MKLRFSPRARQDIDSIFDYLNERNPSSAKKITDAIHASVDLLKDYPYLAPESTMIGARMQFVRRYNFQIFYRAENDMVEIIHIRHTARMPFTGGN